jgi:hypothetical protein
MTCAIVAARLLGKQGRAVNVSRYIKTGLYTRFFLDSLGLLLNILGIGFIQTLLNHKRSDQKLSDPTERNVVNRFLILLLAAILCGCSHRRDPRDAKIVELQNRVATLESNVTDLISITSSNIVTLKKINHSTDVILTSQSNEMNNIDGLLDLYHHLEKQTVRK